MPRGFSPNAGAVRLRKRLERAAGACTLIALVFGILLGGKPNFTNASKPPRGISGVALQVVRNLVELDDILGDAPSADREVMRFKQYLDFGFIPSYTALFVLLGVLLMRSEGWWRAAGIAAIITAVATGLFDVLEDLAILQILDLPLSVTSPRMLNAIRSASFAKWTLFAVTVALLSIQFFGRPRTRAVIGGLMLVSAAMVFYGLYDPRFLVWQAYGSGAALLGITALFLIG